MQLVAIAADEAADAAKLQGKLPRVRLLNDRTGRVITGWGRREGDHPKPATFVIDATGVVRFAHVAGEDEAEWPTVDAVRAALAALP